MTEAPALSVGTFTPLDISYTYNLDKSVGPMQGATLSIGANNVFDELAPFVPFPGFQSFLPTLHDIRGRAVWARAVMNF